MTQSSDPAVFVVLPVRNRWEATQRCLASIEAQVGCRPVVIVVNDGSVDDTSARVRDGFPDAVLVEGDGSLWWAGATNAGVGQALARARGDDYILLLNNDTTIPKDYVDTLVRIARGSGRALVGSVAVDAADRQTVVDGGPMVNWGTAKAWSENAGRQLAACREDGIRQVEASFLPGRGTLVPVACFNEVGLFDERRLPHYGADYEFSRRAAQHGYRLVMSYEAVVYSSDAALWAEGRRTLLPENSLRWLLFSRRSPVCLLYRWRLARLSAPKRLVVPYLVADTVRVVVASARDRVLARVSDSGSRHAGGE